MPDLAPAIVVVISAAGVAALVGIAVAIGRWMRDQDDRRG